MHTFVKYWGSTHHKRPTETVRGFPLPTRGGVYARIARLRTGRNLLSLLTALWHASSDCAAGLQPRTTRCEKCNLRPAKESTFVAGWRMPTLCSTFVANRARGEILVPSSLPSMRIFLGQAVRPSSTAQ